MRRKDPLSILIADDHPVVRRGLRMLLEIHPGWRICGEAGSGSEAIRRVMQFRPNLVLLDISMPDMNGLEATKEIHRASPQTKVLILTMHYSQEFIQAAVKAGASGYVLKSDAEADLVSAVGEVTGGRTFFTNAAVDIFLGLRGASLAAHEEIGPDSLTRREYQVMRLIAEGKSNKELAGELGISTRTAENHRASIMTKLSLPSMSHLVRFAVRYKMVAP
jgi:DNA-binding NarL/FixJ family response regulator